MMSMSAFRSKLQHVIENEDDSYATSTENSFSAKSSLSDNTNETVQCQSDAIEESELGEAKVGVKSKSCDKNVSRIHEENLSYAANKNIAEGLMDIALLSANANQLRFLITYNNTASTFFISIGLVAVSLTMQLAVGIALIFKRRMKRCTRNNKKYARTNEFLICGVFIITVVNILLAAFTTTDSRP